MIRPLAIVSLILLFVNSAGAALTVRLEGVRDSLSVGQKMEVKLSIVPPGPGHIILPDWTQTLDKFDLLAPADTSGLKITNGQPVTIGLSLTSYEAGEQVFQPVSIRWVSPDGSQVDSAETEPLIVHVRGVVPDSILALADSTQKPYKLLQPNRVKKLGWSLAEILPWVLGILAAGGLFYLLRRLWRKHRRRQLPIEETLPPPRPAHEIALEELDRLRDAQVYQSGRIKDYYIQLSEIIRRYLEARYHIPALESTSFQLLEDMATRITDNNLRSLLQYLLDDADLAKFAKQRPDEETCQKDLEKAYILVRKTTPEAAPLLVGEAA